MATSQTNLDDLQHIQNISCRIILKVNNCSSVKGMHQQLKLMPLKDRRDIHCSQICHKAVYEQPPHSLNHFFNRVQQDRARVTRTSNAMTMKLSVLKSVKSRKAFSYRGPNHWNKLDNDLKNTVKFVSLKTKLINKYKPNQSCRLG